VKVTLNPAAQNTEAPKAQAHPADSFLALLNLASLDDSAAGSANASLVSATKTFSPTPRSLVAGAPEKSKGQAKESSKTAEVATSNTSSPNIATPQPIPISLSTANTDPQSGASLYNLPPSSDVLKQIVQPTSDTTDETGNRTFSPMPLQMGAGTQTAETSAAAGNNADQAGNVGFSPMPVQVGAGVQTAGATTAAGNSADEADETSSSATATPESETIGLSPNDLNQPKPALPGQPPVPVDERFTGASAGAPSLSSDGTSSVTTGTQAAARQTTPVESNRADIFLISSPTSAAQSATQSTAQSAAQSAAYSATQSASQPAAQPVAQSSNGKLAPGTSDPRPKEDASVSTSANPSSTHAAPKVETGSENQPVALPAQDDTGAASVVQAPMPDAQNAALQFLVPGANDAGQSYADMFKNAKPSSSSFPTSSAQAGNAVASDKNSRAQQKSANDFSPAPTAQNASADAGLVKQVVAAVKADDSLGQNSPTQSGPTPVPANTNLASNTIQDHSLGKNTNPDPPVAGEPALPQPEAYTAAPMGSVQTARLVQNLSESELRVGIQSGEFGKIDIHTSINQSQISARIYVEHDELGKALALGLPQLHEKLSVDHRIDAQIQLYNSGSSYSSGADRQQDQQQRTFGQNGSASRDVNDSSPVVETVPEPSSTVVTTGLDMHV
jgi:hypothetical protein